MSGRSVLRLFSIMLVLLVSATAFAQGPAIKANKPDKPAKAEKVSVCHVTGDGTYRLITISNNAVPAHTEHGDALPGSLVGTKYVGEECSLVDTTRVASTPMAFGPMGWGGWSCPAGTTVVGGGFEPAEAIVAASGPAKPDSVVGGYTYPTFPHYTFPTGETGWVVQNSNTSQTLTVYAICVAQ